MTMATTSADGLLIGEKWRVGHAVGAGEFGSVHSLVDLELGQETDFVIKLVPLPKKTTRKKDSIPERNARILHYETIVYQCQLPEYQGEVIPMLPGPGGPPASGDVDGFRFLVMERMEAPLWEIIPLILQLNLAKISIGPIAVQLLRCIQIFHENGQIVIDIKPENFMLSSNKKSRNTKKKDNSKVQELASQIRLLDLGLLRQWKGINGHQPDEGISEVVGTPLYASLNVHAGHTPSRRDDLEALGYLLAEMIIQLVEFQQVKKSGGRKGRSTTTPSSSCLPWAGETSDKLIGQAKENEVNNLKSEFYASLGDSDTATILKKYLDEVRGYKYKETPDYEKLNNILSQLETKLSSKSSKKKKRATGTKLRREASAKKDLQAHESYDSMNKTKIEGNPKSLQETITVDDENDDDNSMIEAFEESPRKIQRIIAVDDDDRSDTSYEDAQDDNGTTYEDAQECFYDDAQEGSPEDMDWEVISNQNVEPSDENDELNDENLEPGVDMNNAIGMQIFFEEGPYRGKTVLLIKNVKESLVLGRNPKTTGEESLAVPNDSELDKTHVRFELKSSRKLCSIQVTDLDSRHGTLIGSKRLKQGKSCRVFHSDIVYAGQSTIKILSLKPKVQSNNAPKPKGPPEKIIFKSENTGMVHEETNVKPSNKADSSPKTNAVVKSTSVGKKKLGVRIVVSTGPHLGDAFVLEKGATESLGIGSRPSRKKCDLLELDKDKGIEPNHVRLDLHANKKLVKVDVIDLKSGGSTQVNGRSIPQGKHCMAFVNDKIKIGETVMEIKML